MSRRHGETWSRVFILGAGFSKPAGLPLASELTDLLIHKATKNGELRDLAEWIDQIRRSVELADGQDNVEQLLEACFTLRELYDAQRWVANSSMWLQEKRREWEARVGRLLNSVVDVIWECQSRLSAPSEYVQAFVKQLEPHDVILSFNYDTVVESAMRDTDRSWTHGLAEGAEPGRIRILKLHGSIDWLLVKPGEDFVVSNTVLWNASGDCPFKMVRPDESVGHALAVRTMNGWRNGIAPLGGRKPIAQIPGLGMIWALASNHLRLCDEVIAVGFSFSPFDLMVRLLLGQERQQRGSPPVMTVIDRFPVDPARRLVRLMGGPVCCCESSADAVPWDRLGAWIEQVAYPCPPRAN